MPHLIARTLGWLTRKAGLLLLILGVLVGGAWLKEEWDEYQKVLLEIEAKKALIDSLQHQRAAMDAAIERDATTWKTKIAEAGATMRAELAALETRIARAEPLWKDALARFADLERQERGARAAAEQARTKVRSMSDDMWPWDPLLNPQKLVALEVARAKLRALELNATVWREALERVAPTIAASPLAALERTRQQQLQEIKGLAESVSPERAELMASRARTSQELAAVGGLLSAQLERVRNDPSGRLIGYVETWLPAALWILASALLLPLLLRAIFYFVLAPLASRLAPIQILDDPKAPLIPQPLPSAVSVAIEIAPGEELLVQAGMLQSSSLGAHKQTQWLLNQHLPFASLASGMFALTRIRPAQGSGTQVVVSSQHDGLDEVGVLDLPPGAAMVLQPRSLAGVLKPADKPLRISRHWRLGSLHAWLTLQLRYLVFHGPCRLIVKGCRGVRAEEPQAGQPRLINQSATLGFSANLSYRTTRCETFVAYLRGQESLFNDLFGGGPGRFVYEEMPAKSRRTGITGRGLEGLVDAGMKVFGI